MATLVFKAFAGFNNALCDQSGKGWLTLVTTPFVVGGLNIIIYLCILITALILCYGTSANWQNTNSAGQKSFPRSLLFAAIDWYFVLLIIALIYKLFFCKRTVGASRAYTQMQSLKRAIKP